MTALVARSSIVSARVLPARYKVDPDKLLADVRFGSKADIEVNGGNVRFTPKSGHRNSPVECPPAIENSGGTIVTYRKMTCNEIYSKG